MKMKKILAAAMAAALLTGTLAMGGCSSDSGKLVMVTEAGFAPYESVSYTHLGLQCGMTTGIYIARSWKAWRMSIKCI